MTGTILLVEDEEDLRELIREALLNRGYGVYAVRDGLEAREALVSLNPCLVLADLLMPRMSGWDLVTLMKAQPALARIPVIIYTSTPDQAPAEATRVLGKPASLAQLYAAIAELCGN